MRAWAVSRPDSPKLNLQNITPRHDWVLSTSASLFAHLLLSCYLYLSPKDNKQWEKNKSRPPFDGKPRKPFLNIDEPVL